ncbi:hypothetical protein [Pseudomonas leptonychotis]|uniref:Uncharacterized protein n=1 Tax=Pseudomonas leptonychotis TaxID=2448482 RepID=A0A4T2A414_9PSED|nr:hypothetical protein [Pseudomonas leptonychotis]TIH10959.1 hypothetical protein D8779_09860 [Pseudomonas leptonychotis]
MNGTFRTDAIATAIAIAAVTALTLIKGDVLFMGLWYYTLVLLGTFALARLIKPKPLFITGGIVAACLSFSMYIYANWTPAPTNDLLGLGHLCSLPGAAIGLLIGAVISRRAKQKSSTAAFVAGISGFGLGFAANQAVLCSTVMSCRALLPFL